MQKKSIFRKISLERLSSPEQLDQLMRVTNPTGWVALLALIFLLVTAILWSVFGSIPTRVAGQGIVISPGGVKDVVSGVSGQVADVYFDVGDLIQTDQVIARIIEPDRTVGTPVLSPYSGRILEVQVDEGMLIGVNTSILTVEVGERETADEAGRQQDMQVIIYVSPTEGKKIAPGMEAQISPSTVKREEFGLMPGRVISVGEFPATFQGMLRTLGNEKLVQTLSAGGASIEVHIDLLNSEETVSGFQWTSPEGPPVRIENGTPATAWIVLRQQRPLSLVLPMFK